MKTYLGILAGGSGERLWPLSTQQRPKQLIPFVFDKTLFSLTIDRLVGCVSDQELFVVATSDLSAALQKEAGNAVDFYIEEPAPRNTAPAILLSCLKLYERDPESLVGFFPADHFIPDKKAFQKIPFSKKRTNSIGARTKRKSRTRKRNWSAKRRHGS